MLNRFFTHKVFVIPDFFKRILLAIFFLVVIIIAAKVKADVLLPTIEVTGDFLDHISAEEVQEFPGSRTVTTAEISKERGDQEIKDVIRRIPGLISSKSNGTGGNGTALNIGVRGLTQRLTPRSTVLLDGIPLSVAPYGQPQLSLAPVSLGTLQSIDVVRGGGSVRYGPQNVGGIINFVTRDVPESTQGEVSVSANYYDGAKSSLHAGALSAFIGGKLSDKTGLALLYGGQHGATWRAHSKQDIDQIILKGAHQINDHQRLYARALYYKADSKLPGGLSVAEYADNSFQSTRPHDVFEGDRSEIVLGYGSNLSSTLKLDAKAFYNDSFREFTFAKGSPDKAKRLDRLPRSYNVLGLEARLAKALKLGNAKAEWGVGYRYLTEDAHEQRFRRSHDEGANPFLTDEKLSRDSENKTKAHSFYTDLSIDWGKLKVTPGIRFENVTISRENKLPNKHFFEEIDYNKALPSVGLNYELRDQLNLFASYNRSFGSVQHLQLNLQEKANTLNPELADTIELGLRYNSNKLSGEATLFNIDFDNQLVFNADEKFWENRGETKHRGLELAGTLNLSNSPLQVYANYTYLKATDEELNKGNDLEFASKHAGLLGLEYVADKGSAFIEMYGQSSQFADPKNTEEESANGGTGNIPGFSTVNLGASYPIGKKLSLSGGIKNVLDKEYFSRSRDSLGRGKYREQPRTAYISVNYKF